MKYILFNYNFTPDWVKEYTDDYVIYDKSPEKDKWVKDFPPEKIIRIDRDVGNVDHDKMSYLIDNYENLPEVFLFSKSNLFKFISKEEFNELKDKKEFTPILTKNHKTYLPICFYDKGIYNELNNSWYIQAHPTKIGSYSDFAEALGIPSPYYLPFAPGGNYILTKETVHKYPKEFYAKIRDMLEWDKSPGEAHMVERSYYQLWK